MLEMLRKFEEESVDLAQDEILGSHSEEGSEEGDERDILSKKLENIDLGAYEILHRLLPYWLFSSPLIVLTKMFFPRFCESRCVMVSAERKTEGRIHASHG